MDERGWILMKKERAKARQKILPDL